MTECKNCRKEIKDGELLECKHCGATICSDCAKKTKNICPYCYSDLDIKG